MNSEQEAFLRDFNVPYETIHNLSTYENMLRDWNNRFNLVASSTLDQVWQRHFADSIQLMSFIPDNTDLLADMGAGAGFPGLVLAIVAKTKGLPLQVVEIESTGKKADFLQAVVDELKLNVIVRRDRIEAIRDLKADIITARALKALPELLKYANYLMHKDTICIFPKGKNAEAELTEARKYWTFKSDNHPSRSDDSGTILVLTDLRYKTRR